MTERKDYHLSEPQRIQIVRDWLAIGMKNNDIQLHEVRRAMAMLMREDDEQRRNIRLNGHPSPA